MLCCAYKDSKSTTNVRCPRRLGDGKEDIMKRANEQQRSESAIWFGTRRIIDSWGNLLHVGCYRSHTMTKELRSRCIKRKFLGHRLGSDREFQNYVSFSFIGCLCVFLTMFCCPCMFLSLSLSLRLSSRCPRQLQSWGWMRWSINSSVCSSKVACRTFEVLCRTFSNHTVVMPLGCCWSFVSVLLCSVFVVFWFWSLVFLLIGHSSVFVVCFHSLLFEHVRVLLFWFRMTCQAANGDVNIYGIWLLTNWKAHGPSEAVAEPTSWPLRRTTTSWPNPRCFASHRDHPLFHVTCLSAHLWSNVTSRHCNKGGVWNRWLPRPCRWVPCPEPAWTKTRRSESWDHDSPLQRVITGEHLRTPKTRGLPMRLRDQKGQDVGGIF